MRRRVLIPAAIILSLAVIVVISLRLYFRTESLAGADANHDGVRDDVEFLIKTKYGKDPKLRSILRQLAKASEAAPGHHAHHHRHDFTTGKEKITLLTAESRPYVGEFLDEVMNNF
jgi:hypothetical protein